MQRLCITLERLTFEKKRFMSGDKSQPTYPAEKTRQGEIILRTRTQRIVFIAGLAGMLLVGLIAMFFD